MRLEGNWIKWGSKRFKGIKAIHRVEGIHRVKGSNRLKDATRSLFIVFVLAITIALVIPGIKSLVIGGGNAIAFADESGSDLASDLTKEAAGNPEAEGEGENESGESAGEGLMLGATAGGENASTESASGSMILGATAGGENESAESAGGSLMLGATAGENSSEEGAAELTKGQNGVEENGADSSEVKEKSEENAADSPDGKEKSEENAVDSPDGKEKSEENAEDSPDGKEENSEGLEESNSDGVEINRLAGEDRYETAIAIANSLKEVLGVEKFNNIVVASGEDYPDALSGAYLADQNDAPIILVSKTNVETMSQYIRENLQEAGKVFILGGKYAVSEELDKKLSGCDIKRVFGQDRYGTNLAILTEANASKTSDDLLMCSGQNYPDAIAAASTGKPILLVAKALSDAQKKYLEKDDSNYYIIGGNLAVSTAVEDEVKKYGDVVRVYGDNRYETSVAIAEQFSYGSTEEKTEDSGSDANEESGEEAGKDTNEKKSDGATKNDSKEAKANTEGKDVTKNDIRVLMASGKNFPDGLTGGPLAAKLGLPIILADNSFPIVARNFILDKKVKGLTFLGGSALISDNIATKEKGFIELGSEICFVEEDGRFAANRWFEEESGKMYALGTGVMARNTVFTVDGLRYGAGDDCGLVKGFAKIKGKEYYFLPTYAMPTKMNTTYTYNFIQSPNIDKGRAGSAIDTIVIHYWGDDNATFAGVVSWFLTPASRVSAHYVAMSGKVTQMVWDSDRAHHGGGPNINKRSIGIECRPAKTAGDMNTVAELICDIWVRHGEIIPLSEHRDHAWTSCPGNWSADEMYKLAKAMLPKRAII